MSKKDKHSSSESKKNKKNSKISPAAEAAVEQWETAYDENITDILGSYTGKPKKGYYPEQDADDL